MTGVLGGIGANPSSMQGGSVDCGTYDVLLQLEKPIGQDEVCVRFDRSKFDVRLSAKYEERIQETWRKRVESNPKLYNASKFRLCTVNESKSEKDSSVKVELGIGLCDYARYLGTNRSSDEELIRCLKEEGISNADDASAFFANPFGNAALVITSDGCIPFFRRSFQTAEFALWWDVPGGHPEPSRIRLPDFTDDAESVNAQVLSELFSSTKDEVRTELNIPLEHIGEPLLIGIVRAHASRGKPSAVFVVEVSMTAADVAKVYTIGGEEADESTVLAFVSKDVLVRGYGALTMVTQGTNMDQTALELKPPVSYEEIKSHIVPTAAFAFDLIRHGSLV
jgi:hypothetical protein